ncbi:MAG: PTS sugar transporter subunit IIA [Kiritimatiellales bacterium]|jgi:mannitol/fructose-specific phosphotransferase system IIA component (Ntr-type)
MTRKEKHMIKHLIQLQDLVAARAQQQASMPSQRFQQLDRSIKTLDDELPIELKTHFNRLLQKSIEAIVPVHGDNCSGCGFALTKTMVNSIAAGNELNRCPNCTRILYKPDVPLTRRSTRRRWGDPVKRGIERFSAPELMIASLKGTTKEEILLEMCENLRAEGYVENCTDLHDAALRREAIVPTAVEHGIAFPHVRGVEGGGLTLTLGISKKGVDFGAPGEKLTRIFFYMVIPTAASAFYLKLLSGLTQSFATKAARDSLLNAKTQEELWKALVKATKKMIQ